MSFYPAKKGTILIPSGRTDHLSIICCDPVYYPRTLTDSVLIVNVSTVTDKNHVDKTCILKAGDHEFIRHDSFIFYQKADIYSVDNIIKNVNDGSFVCHKPCNDDIFNRILLGFETSKFVIYKVKQFYLKHCK